MMGIWRIMRARARQFTRDAADDWAIERAENSRVQALTRIVTMVIPSALFIGAIKAGVRVFVAVVGRKRLDRNGFDPERFLWAANLRPGLPVHEGWESVERDETRPFLFERPEGA